MVHTAVITGGTSGIGRETAVALARLGMTVVVTSRDPAGRGATALTAIRATSGSDDVHLLPLDLASFASIRRFGAEVLERFERLDVLLNNAGLVLSQRAETAEGFEMTFGVNHLGHFLLTGLLLDRLRASAPARVVTVSSLAHRFLRRMPFENLQSGRRYSPIVAYSASKLANVLFSLELARRLGGSGVTSNAMHPVAVRTSFAQDGDTAGWLRWGMALARPVFLPPAAGARTLTHLAARPEVEGVTGGYFAWNRRLRPSRVARDPEAARRLWELSERLVVSAPVS